MWELGVKFHGYRIDGLHYEPPDPKNSILQRVIGEKGFFLYMLITSNMVLILFLPIRWYAFTAIVLTLQTHFISSYVYLYNQETDFHSVSSLNVLKMCGRCE